MRHRRLRFYGVPAGDQVGQLSPCTEVAGKVAWYFTTGGL
jgi:hypothetical protein